MTSPSDRWGPSLGAKNLGAGQWSLGEMVGKAVRSHLLAESDWKAQGRVQEAEVPAGKGFKGVL